NYDEYVNQQKQGYETIAKIVGYTIEKMQTNGLISGNVKITGRIKSYKSVLENSKRKIVDDCFGIRIIASKDDIKRIREELAQILVIVKTKYHKASDKKKYNAVHQMVDIPKTYISKRGISYELFPVVEIQYWDIQNADLCIGGELSYAHYKKKDLERILERYLENPQETLDELPICYDIYGKNVRQLLPEETLFRVYPEIKQIQEQRKEDPDDDEVEV
ncbi:MAG: hypothetical protein ACI4VQ_02150, partial [Clostridia bacterium]